MQNAFYYFEKNHQVPPVIVNAKGEYVIEEVAVPASSSKPDIEVGQIESLLTPNSRFRKRILLSVWINCLYIQAAMPAFKIFIDKLSVDMIKELEPGQT